MTGKQMLESGKIINSVIDKKDGTARITEDTFNILQKKAAQKHFRAGNLIGSK
jgi:hypothetical protein